MPPQAGEQTGLLEAGLLGVSRATALCTIVGAGKPRGKSIGAHLTILATCLTLQLYIIQ